MNLSLKKHGTKRFFEDSITGRGTICSFWEGVGRKGGGEFQRYLMIKAKVSNQAEFF